MITNEHVVPKVVVVPSVVSAHAKCLQESSSSRPSKFIENETAPQSVQQLENARRQGQDMLRQLVYGDTTKSKKTMDVAEVDWKAVIELADKLHRREQRLLKRLGKKHTRCQSRDTDRTVSAPSTPQSSALHRRNTTASTTTTPMQDFVQHETAACDSIPPNKKAQSWRRRLWLFLFPWRRFSDSKSQKRNQTLIEDNPSSFSINLISCTPETPKATQNDMSPSSKGDGKAGMTYETCSYRDVHAVPTSSPTHPPNIHRQRELQQVVTVGCHGGIFASWKYSSLYQHDYKQTHQHKGTPLSTSSPTTASTYSHSFHPDKDIHHDRSNSFINLDEDLNDLIQETIYRSD